MQEHKVPVDYRVCFAEGNYRDFSTDWNGTYFRATAGDRYKGKPMLVQHCGPDGTVSFNTFNNQGAFNDTVRLNASLFREFFVPVAQVFCYQHIPMIYERKAERQFKRGICQATSRLYAADWRHIGFQSDFSTREEYVAILDHLFEKTEYTPKDAVWRTVHGAFRSFRGYPAVGCCLSHELAVTRYLAAGYKSPILSFWSDKIGWLPEEGKAVLTKEWEFLVPKVQDYLEVVDVV